MTSPNHPTRSLPPKKKYYSFSEIVADMKDFSDKETIRQIPDFVMESHRKGRWNAEMAEKHMCPYHHANIVKKGVHYIGSIMPSVNAALAVPKEYWNGFYPSGPQTPERIELFTRLAVLYDWIEIKGGKSLDCFGLALKELKTQDLEENNLQFDVENVHPRDSQTGVDGSANNGEGRREQPDSHPPSHKQAVESVEKRAYRN
ncbi:hypothetical protein BDW69DRAFT_184815 [Aspergillus filifer]